MLHTDATRARAPDNSDGQSWATALHDLQEALSLAAEDGTVHVAGGQTFALTSQIVWPSMDGITIAGGYEASGVEPGARDPAQWPTIITRNPANNIRSINAHFVDGGDLRIAWLPIKYTTGGYSGPPLPGDRIVKGDAWLKATWPISHVRVKYYPWPGITWGGNVNTGTGAIKLLNYLNRLLQLSQTQPRPDHVYGWLPTSVYLSNGIAWLPGKTAFGNDTDGRWRRTLTHELGHNRAIGHWAATIRPHGLAVRDKRRRRRPQLPQKRRRIDPAELEVDHKLPAPAASQPQFHDVLQHLSLIHI